MPFKAYQQTVSASEDPRATEYRLFGQVTRALMAADRADKSDLITRADALDWNRRMWSVLGLDCSAEGNMMPDALRAQIVSLSIWVNKHTSLAIRGEEDILPLIEVNRIIMEGLAPQNNNNITPISHQDNSQMRLAQG